MKSLQRQEGWLYIDNRNNPGVGDTTMRQLGLPSGSGSGLFEAPTYTCAHCHSVVVMEPRRTRERGFCTQCDQNLCDPCNAVRAMTRTCTPMEKIIEDVQEAATRSETNLIVLP